MSRLLDYFVTACEGIGSYLNQNHFFVILVTVLLVLWLMEHKQVSEKQNRMLVYTLIMSVLLLCPITAVAVMIYQTSFFDYEWAWSMVPVTAVIAYGLVWFWNRQERRGHKLGVIILTVMILVLAGNQGRLQEVSEVEAQTRKEIDEIIQEIHSVESGEAAVVWAPKRVMQEIRRHDGQIALVYGRDMWDQKAGAYDYEAYSEEVTESYLWLEKAIEYSDFARSLENSKEAIAQLDELYDWSLNGETNLEQILLAGANTIIWPNVMSEYMEATVLGMVQEKGLKLQKAYTEEYTIYVVH